MAVVDSRLDAIESILGKAGAVSKKSLSGVLRALARAAIATPQDYGARGDGKTIDGPAIARSMNSESNLYFPPGEYLFDKVQVVQGHNKCFRGGRGGTVFRHVGGQSNPTLNSFFIWGNQHPYAFDKRTPRSAAYPRLASAGPISYGQNFVELAHPNDIEGIAAGQVVWVRDAQEFARNGWVQPDYAQLLRIDRITNNTLVFDRNIDADIRCAIISPILGIDPFSTSILGTDVHWGVCKNVLFEGITFIGGTQAFARMSSFRGVFKDIEHWGCVMGPMCNAFSESIIENWRGHYSLRGVEIKMCSGGSSLNNVSLTYRPIRFFDNNVSVPVHPFEFGERSHDITINNLDISVSEEWSGSQALINFQDVRAFKLTSSRILIAGGGSNVPVLKVEPVSDPGSARNVTDIRVAFNSFSVLTEKAAAVILHARSGCSIAHVAFVANYWSGVPTSGRSAYIARGDVRNVSLVAEQSDIADVVISEDGADLMAMDGRSFKRRDLR